MIHSLLDWVCASNVYFESGQSATRTHNILQGARFSPESIRSDAVSESERETSGISHA